jgi:MYXO-CTERM domain-containing protein
MKDPADVAHGGAMKLLPASLALVVLTVPALASASNPASAWADVEEVTFEPSAKDVNTATRVIIKGVFARSNMDASFPTYAKPQRGYFYYECPSGKLDLCRLEWKDIVAAIGTSNCAGWGDGAKTPGTIHPWCETTTTADIYPIHMGVQRTPWANGTCDGLKAFAAPPVCSGTDGGVSDSGPADTGVADTGTTVSDSGSTDTGAQPVEDTGTATVDTGTAPSGGSDTGSGSAPAAPAGTDDKSGCSFTGAAGNAAASTTMLSPFALIALGLLRASRRRARSA